MDSLQFNLPPDLIRQTLVSRPIVSMKELSHREVPSKVTQLISGQGRIGALVVWLQGPMLPGLPIPCLESSFRSGLCREE